MLGQLLVAGSFSALGNVCYGLCKYACKANVTRHGLHLILQSGDALTALRFDDTGLGCAVGTSGGLVALFDLRARSPLVVKDHMYGQRITDIKFQQPSGGGLSGADDAPQKVSK